MTPEKIISIGESIKAMRDAYAWSQEEFAERIDISCRALQRIEAGESLPTAETISRIGETMAEWFMGVRDACDPKGMGLCSEEVDLAVGVGLAKAERIIREKK